MYAMVKDGKTAEERALEYSQNAGINYIVRPKTKVLTCLENGDEQGYYKEIDKFSSYNSFKGIFISDEPTISIFETISLISLNSVNLPNISEILSNKWLNS